MGSANFVEFSQSLRDNHGYRTWGHLWCLLYKLSKWENPLHAEHTNGQGFTTWSINPNFPCSTPKDFSLRIISMTIYTTSWFQHRKKKKSCRLVGHPIYLPPNTIPLGELLQLKLWERNKPGENICLKFKNNRKLLTRVQKETSVRLTTSTIYSLIEFLHAQQINSLHCCCWDTVASRHSLKTT